MQRAHGSYGYPLDEFLDVNFDHVRFVKLLSPISQETEGQPESVWRVKLTFSDGQTDAYVLAPKATSEDRVYTELNSLRSKFGSKASGLSAEVPLPAITDPAS